MQVYTLKDKENRLNIPFELKIKEINDAKDLEDIIRKFDGSFYSSSIENLIDIGKRRIKEYGSIYLICKKGDENDCHPLSPREILCIGGNGICNRDVGEKSEIGKKVENIFFEYIRKRYKIDEYIKYYGALGLFFKDKYTFLVATNIDLAKVNPERKEVGELREAKSLIVVYPYFGDCYVAKERVNDGMGQLYIAYKFSNSVSPNIHLYIDFFNVVQKNLIGSFIGACKEMYNRYGIGEYITDIQININGKSYILSLYYHGSMNLDKEKINKIENMINESLEKIIENYR